MYKNNILLHRYEFKILFNGDGVQRNATARNLLTKKQGIHDKEQATQEKSIEHKEQSERSERAPP
jgi:hypothetical protein